MTNRQIEMLNQIRDKWEKKMRGTYINRKNSKAIYFLAEKGLVKIFPYTLEFGNEAFPSEAE